MAAKLDAVDYLPTRVVCGDDTYIYAIISDDLYRAESKDDTLTICYTHPLGHDILNVWPTSVSGTLFMACKNITTSKTYLYKSIDYGTSFGNNSPAYDNDAYVAIVGDVDGTETNQINNCEILGRGFCELAGVLYFGEYNVNGSRVNGGANDQVRVVSSADGGDTWETAAEWNTNGDHHVRHIHGINTDGQALYISFGDNDSEAGILRWDVANELPGNQALSAYEDCLSGSQAYRTGDVLFPPGSQYMFWMADSDEPDETRGIYRALRDMSAPAERVNSDIVSFASHSGWYGVVIDAQTMVFSEFLEIGAVDYQMNFYSTSDGGNTWALVAKYGSANISSGTRAFFKWKDGNIYYERRGAGKNYLCTVVFKSTSKEYSEEFPVILHPVYWVSQAGVDAAGRGYRPSSPWANPSYALSGNRVTHGARIICAAGEYNVGAGKIIPGISAHAIPGYALALTVIEGAGELNTTIKSTGTTEGVLYIEKDATPFLIKKLLAKSEKDSITNNVLTVATHAAPKKGKVFVRDATLGQRVSNANAVCNNYQDLDIKRVLLAGTTTMTAVRARANSDTQIESSVLLGHGKQIYCSNANAKISVKNTDFIDYASTGITTASGTTLVPEVKNCAFIPRAGATADMSDEAGLTETDEKIDYNYYSGTRVNIANNGGSHSIVGGDPKLSTTNFRIQADSPLRGSGADVGVDRDFAGEPFASTPSIGAHEYSRSSWGRESTLTAPLPLSAQPCKGHALPIGTGKITVFPGVASQAQIEEATE